MYIAVKYIWIIFLCISPILSYSEPHQYKAVYSFSLKGIEFANSEHNLTYDKNRDEWCINTISYTVNIFSLKEDTRTENSCFTFHKTNNKDLNIPKLNGYLVFKSYHFERIRSGEIRSVVSKVIDSKVVSTLNEKDVRYDDNSKLDRLTAQIFGYALNEININDKGRERKYTFRHIRDDKIKTIFGDTNVKIIKKDIVNNKRSSLIWYSLDNNHLPVMIEQYRLDKLMFRATLKSFED